MEARYMNAGARARSSQGIDAKWIWGGGALVAAVLLLGWASRLNADPDGDPQTIINASLEALREQDRLTPLAAQYVTVLAPQQGRDSTLFIAPAKVRYEVDVDGLDRSDLDWNATTKQLEVMLPKLRVTGPELDLSSVAAYRGGVKMKGGSARLDSAMRKAARQDLLKQAQADTPMKAARDTARKAVSQNFAMPLKAAGIDAGITVRFADE